MRNSVKHSATALHAARSASSSVPALSLAAVWRWTSRVKVILRLCLCSSAAVVLLGDVSAAYAQPPNPKGVAVAADRIGDFVAEASRRFSIPPSWIRAVMRVESLGDPLAVSPKGAMGLMQIMPDTWSELRSRYGLGADPYDAHDNIMAGAAYLREMHDRYGERGFLAAYNAGPSRYEEHLATRRPLPSETLIYMAAVASLVGAGVDEGGRGDAVSAASWTAAPLFLTRLAAGSSQSRPTPSAQMPKGLVGEAVQGRAELTPLRDGLFVKPSARDGRP
ncbi:Transglycosylase SLT domain-containing protein [Rhodospirillales bacterium URHD0017]|nr:Transglycosylase SLT domain-containing protein [Rhodospirillales bacterium URHD0017]